MLFSGALPPAPLAWDCALGRLSMRSHASLRADALRLKKADYKKAYVYLSDEVGAQRPRYHEIEAQLTPDALASWPAKPGRSVQELREKVRQEKQRR
jgi:hypothetical protein